MPFSFPYKTSPQQQKNIPKKKTKEERLLNATPEEQVLIVSVSQSQHNNQHYADLLIPTEMGFCKNTSCNT
jgi:hypothetical protein